MKGGDLSNEIGPGIGIRFEGVIKTEEGKLNRTAKAFLATITRATDANVYVVTSNEARKAMAFCLKWSIPYHKVIQVDSDLEIPDVVREHDLLTYYDLDKRVLQNINSRGYQRVQAKLWTEIQT